MSINSLEKLHKFLTIDIKVSKTLAKFKVTMKYTMKLNLLKNETQNGLTNKTIRKQWFTNKWKNKKWKNVLLNLRLIKNQLNLSIIKGKALWLIEVKNYMNKMAKSLLKFIWEFLKNKSRNYLKSALLSLNLLRQAITSLKVNTRQ